MPEGCLATMSAVTHRYGEVVALDGLDLEIRPGEVLAVLGPNGAGKTTAIGLLLGSQGSLRAQEGTVRVFGCDPGARAVRMRRGAMLQVSGVADTLTIAEHLELFSSYYPAPLPVSRLLAMAGLEDLGERRYGRLSGGQKQRVMFALALAGDPELVFLDEPTTGLDVEARRSLWNEIRGLEAAARTAVLTTHYLEEADALADRFVVIHQGRVVAEGMPAETKSRTADRRVRCITSVGPLLALDPDLRDLHVAGAGLDDAFLTLVRDGDTYGVFGLIGPSLFGFGVGFATERDSGALLLKQTTPMPVGAYLLARVGTALLFGMAIVLGLFLLGAYAAEVTLYRWQWFALAGVVLSSVIPFCALGLAIGAWVKAQSAVAIVNLVYLPMAFLSGLWIPIALLPSFVRDVAVVFPAYQQSQLALKVVALDEGGSTAVHVLMIGIFTVVFLIVAAIGFRRVGQR